MNSNLLAQVAKDVDEGVAVAVATVVETSRSVPRHAGAKMLIYRDGSSMGTIGGGEMEARVLQEAAGALTNGHPRLVSYRLVDPAQGDPGVCGGDVQIFVEPYMPKPTLVIMGYGHVGRAVATIAGWLDFATIAVDDREALADTAPDSAPDTASDNSAPQTDSPTLITGGVPELAKAHNIGPDTSIVLVTRNVDVDYEILTALADTKPGYIGVMGSERRWVTTRDRLQAAGVSADFLAAIHAPIGVEIGAETPEEIAVSIMAEVLAVRRQAT